MFNTLTVEILAEKFNEDDFARLIQKLSKFSNICNIVETTQKELSCGRKIVLSVVTFATETEKMRNIISSAINHLKWQAKIKDCQSSSSEIKKFKKKAA